MLLIPKIVIANSNPKHHDIAISDATVSYLNEHDDVYGEPSWSSNASYRSEMRILNNIPTEGFSFHKNTDDSCPIGRYDMTDIVIRDPRGIKVDITAGNLEWLLKAGLDMSGTTIKSKLVYAWTNSFMALVPEHHKDYEHGVNNFNMLTNKSWLKPTELIEGNEYLFNDNDKRIYLGKFPVYQYWNGDKLAQDQYWFSSPESWSNFKRWGTLTRRIKADLGPTSTKEFQKYRAIIEKSSEFSPIDIKATQAEPLTEAYLLRAATKVLADKSPYNTMHRYSMLIKIQPSLTYELTKGISNEGPNTHTNVLISIVEPLHGGEPKFKVNENFSKVYNLGKDVEYSIKDFIDKYNPLCVKEYLHNGRVFQTKFDII